MSEEKYVQFNIDQFAGQYWLLCTECNNRFNYEIFMKDKESKALLIEMHKREHERTIKEQQCQ